MDSFFVSTCSVLKVLLESSCAQRSFVDSPKIGIGDVELLPTSALPYVSSDEGVKLQAMANQGLTVGDLVRRGTVKIKRSGESELTVLYDGMQRHFHEIARVDLTGNGIKDLLVFVADYVQEGSFRTFSLLRFSRNSNSKVMEVHDVDPFAIESMS